MCTPERDFSVLRRMKSKQQKTRTTTSNTLFHTIRKLELKKETLEIPIKNQITRYYAGVQSAVPPKELLLTVNRLLGFTFYFHFILLCPLHASS
jgi:hypothetical protein